jgi:hypothetical protein
MYICIGNVPSCGRNAITNNNLIVSRRFAFCSKIGTESLAWCSRHPRTGVVFSEQQRPPVRPCSPGPCRDQVPSESFPVPAPCPAAPTPARNAPHAAGDAARDGFRPGRARGPMPKPTARSPPPFRAPGQPGRPGARLRGKSGDSDGGARGTAERNFTHARSFEPPGRTARPAGGNGPAAAAIAGGGLRVNYL